MHLRTVLATVGLFTLSSTAPSFAITQTWNIDKVGTIQNIEENLTQNIEVKNTYNKTINNKKVTIYEDVDGRQYYHIKGGYIEIKNIENKK